jgi:hypothetical protein
MSKARTHRFPAVHDREIIPSWRRLRHGQNHRAPQTHTEERIYRDESTMPDDDEPMQSFGTTDPEEP